MQSAQTTASKALVAVVAAAMMFSAFAMPAKAQTTEELQAQIATLTAQIAALQGGSTTGGSSSAVCPFTWTRDLKTGATGADVKTLQQFLNSDADTRVAATGAGSAGMETETFGPMTAAAVSKFQVKYRADILTPAGLVNPTGYFGPSTRAKANALCVAGATDDEGDDEGDDEDTELQGEASIRTFEIADGDEADDVEEGSADVAVAEITIEFEDGDASISRLDLALEGDGGNDGDNDPWKVFDTISLWVDDEMVAEFDAADEDNYLDEDDGSMRFTGLDIVAMEDEEVVIVVAATVNGSVDGANNGEGWNLAAGSLRFFDADGVATTETTFGDLQDITGTLSAPMAEFTIEEAGAGDDLNVEESDENPDADTLALDEDDNVEHMIFAFDLSAEDSDGDIEINEVTIVATSTVASNMDDLVNDFRLEIGEDSYDAESYTGTGSTVTLTFDLDGETSIAADEMATAMLYADFEDMEAGDEGSTIVARVSAVDAEGADSGETVDVDGLPLVGETHTLRTEGISIEFVDDLITPIENSDATSTDNEAKFVLEFEVTAFGDTVYLPFGATASTTDLTEGIVYSIINTNTNAVVTTGTAVPSYDMDGDAENNSYKINDGGSKTFTLEVEYDPAASGSYKVRIDKINYALTDAATATASQDVSAQNVDTAQTTISN